MSRPVCRAVRALLAALLATGPLASWSRAEPLALDPTRFGEATVMPPAPSRIADSRNSMGGGFIEFLFGGGAAAPAERYGRQPIAGPADMAHAPIDPKFLPQIV